MKKLLTIIFIAFSATAFGQTKVRVGQVDTGATGLMPKANSYSLSGMQTKLNNYSSAPVGTIYSKAYWTALTDFTAAGFTPTVSGSGIQFTGGSNTYTQTMIINGFTNNDPNPDVEIAFTIGTTGNGIGIGRKSVDVEASVVVQYNETANTMIFTSLTAGTVLATVPSNFTVVNGDFCTLKYSQRGNVITGTFTDYSHTGFTFSSSVPLQTAGYAVGLPNTSDVCFYNIGGTNTISSISYKSRSLYQPTIVYNGDSKTAGLGVFGLPFSWPKQLGVLGSSEIFAGGGDKVADLLAGQAYIINYIKPKAVLINVLRNDLSGGTLTPTNKTNYQTLVTNYQNAGITVYHLLPIPETVISSQSATTTFITTTYPVGTYIDGSSGAVSFNTGTMLNADGIHPNALGNTTVAANILNAAVIPLAGTANPIIPADPITTFTTAFTANNIPFGNGTTTLQQNSGFNFNVSTSRLGIGVTSANTGFTIDAAGSMRLSGNNTTFNIQSTFGTNALLLALPTSAGAFASDAAANDIVLGNYTSGKATRFAFSGGKSVFGMTSAGVYANKPITLNTTPTAINSTATATAAQLATGVLSSTSAAATSITLPTATLMATQIGAAQGTTFPFTIDNTAGANTVTIILGSGMTGLNSPTLTVPSGTAGVAKFELYFSSTTVCTIARLY